MKAATRVGKKNQQFGNQPGRRAQLRKMKSKAETTATELPVNSAESNPKGDQLASLIFFGLIFLAGGLVAGGVYWSATTFSTAIIAPVNWVNIVLATITLFTSLICARALVWLSLFGSMSLAMRMGAWKSVESHGKMALKLPSFLSRGTAWASLFLVQSLFQRGKYDEATEIAEAEWARSGADSKQAQSMGPIATLIGMGKHSQNDMKGSLEWNDRGIEALNKLIEFMNKPNKSWLERAAAQQSGDWLGQVKGQLAATHFTNATIYRSKNDPRRAKENYKKALDYANQCPDFPQKDYLLQVCKEEMQRLKHH
ncbi:MAG: hypothetical protein K2Z81_07500 [Cyanobacteria bacterium]|nr:hypothetical protein [Cyanobacteriota bacterium]